MKIESIAKAEPLLDFGLDVALLHLHHGVGGGGGVRGRGRAQGVRRELGDGREGGQGGRRVSREP